VVKRYNKKLQGFIDYPVYLTREQSEIIANESISEHETETDPHPQYMTQARTLIRVSIGV